MESQTEIRYVSDAAGNRVAVIVPIELWREIKSEHEGRSPAIFLGLLILQRQVEVDLLG
jgi:hypothetical protein